MADNPYQQSNLGGAPVIPAAPGYAPSQLPGVTPSIGTPSVVPVAPAAKPTGVYTPSQLDIIARAETGDRNIKQQIHDINTDRGTPAGGNFQFIDPTWTRMAPKAGVDIRQYPTAMSAPPSVQARVAAVTPINQWGPRTVAILRKYYPNIDTSKPPTGTYHGSDVGGGTVATAPGTTVNTSAASQPSPDWGLAFASLGQEGQGGQKSPIEQAGSAFGGGGQQQQNIPQNLQGEQAAAMGNLRQAQIAQQAQAMAAALQQHAAQPLTWSSQPFGSTAGVRSPPQAQTMMGGVPIPMPGMTLNSMGA